ncbi:hypothetical protein [Spirosoma agri]|uniref:Uncharacterized protein n=1 Tax=Spirosoma agri TaxID=1987381 RepID=A0A6M0ITC1_9BACT|nr:hypothetical protein [Spirosoma agri]NEU70881.1 hypothetical protein [Spirosoma agri]
MKRVSQYFVGLIVLVGVIIVIGLLQPTTYKHRVIKLKGCQDASITEIEYSNPFHRGFAYTYGVYTKPSLPNTNCIVSEHMAGMDAILELWITCNNNKVTFYPATGSFNFRTKDNPNINFEEVKPWEFNEKVTGRKDAIKVVAE